MMIFREYRDGQTFVREEWQVDFREPDSGAWYLAVTEYRRKRKANWRNKHFVLVEAWNLPAYTWCTGAGKLETCPPIPAELYAAALAKLASLPLTYAETRKR